MAIRSFLLGTVAGAGLGVEHLRRESAERLAAAALETLLNAIEANDHETGQHLRRVARYSLILGDAAGLNEKQLRAVERIALFHDIGKIHEALQDAIHDDASLTPEERRAILTHPARGAEVLRPLEPFYPDLPEGVLAHHERWDGTGYPRRLAGEEIPLFTRVVSIGDAFDVIANGRHYQRAGGAEAAAIEIVRERERQFDPDLVDLMMLPPVLHQFALAHQSHYRRTSKSKDDRRHARPREWAVPDVRFRWRSALDERSLPAAPRRNAKASSRSRRRSAT
jgi:HD-GYP domain-containing protein (c-di-GMP phosphodiesterase class II)